MTREDALAGGKFGLFFIDEEPGASIEDGYRLLDTVVAVRRSAGSGKTQLLHDAETL